jgi:hypothetical protein
MLAVAAIVAAMAVTGIAAVATPVFAGGHHHHNNGIKVNQSIDQLNVCSGSPQEAPGLVAPPPRQAPTICLNEGSNNADIQR